MSDVVALLKHHGYAFLALVVFLEAAGLPVPAALALIAAGAAAAIHVLRMDKVLAVALTAMLVGDTLLYVFGRYTGWWLLGILCRLAANPESCVLRSAESFYKRGRVTLLFAKFIPGINTLAPPLAGSMRMRPLEFLRLDFIAALLYTGAYAAAGFIFSGVISAVIARMHSVGRFIEWVLALAFIAYIAYRVSLYWRHRQYRVVPRVQANELAARLKEVGADRVLIVDVRSHGYYDPGATRIRGSIRVEPANLTDALKDVPKDKQIFVYCT
jgi:membrane protein DedA with SNARE-associated domain